MREDYGPPPSTDAIISRLRPRSIGEILDQSFRLYRKHFLTFLAIAAILEIPITLGIQLASAYLEGPTTFDDAFTVQTSNERAISLLLSSGVALLLTLLGGLILSVGHGALTAAVADSYLDRPVTFDRGYAAMWKRVRPLLGAIGIQAVATIAVFLPLIAIFLLVLLPDLNTTGGLASALGLVCSIYLFLIAGAIAVVYLFMRWTVAVPAIMVEDLGARDGLRRSWRLVEGYWWRTLGLNILLAILNAIITGAPTAMIVGLIALFFRDMDFVTLSLVTAIVTALVTTIFVPLQLIATTLYYFDLRVRREGFDLETAMIQRYRQGGGYGAPYRVPYGGPPLGWDTGGGQYSETAPPPSDRGIVPPVLGRSDPFGFPLPGTDGEPPPPAVGDGGTPTLPVSAPQAEEAEEAEPAEPERQPESDPYRTPDWLTPPMLGVRPKVDAEEEETRKDGEKGAG
jgi:hypothetical protein